MIEANQSWACVSSPMRKGVIRAVLRVCYTTLVLSLERCGQLALRALEQARIDVIVITGERKSDGVGRNQIIMKINK